MSKFRGAQVTVKRTDLISNLGQTPIFMFFISSYYQTQVFIWHKLHLFLSN